MNIRIAATALGAAGAAAIVVAVLRSWAAMRRIDSTGPVPSEAGDSVHSPDLLPLAGLEAVIVALGLSAGWAWACLLGALGVLALVRFARRTRVVVTRSEVVFGTGAGSASLDFGALGALVPAPRNGSLRSYGTLGFADTAGRWVGVVRPAVLRRPAVMVATVVERSGMVRHDGEDGWRAPGASMPTARLPYFSR